MNQLDIDYQNLLKDILENGIRKEDRTGTGTLSVFGRQIKYSFKDSKFPLLTTKKMYFKGIVTELLWFLRGDTNIKYLVDNDCHIWDGDAYKNYCKSFENQSIIEAYSFDTDPMSQLMFSDKIKTDKEFAKKWGELGPIYGKQWRDWNDNGTLDDYLKGIDQIANLINDLKTNPDSRRLMVSAWNVGELDQMVLPPCHYGFQVYTRELSEQERVTLLVKKIGSFSTNNFKVKCDEYNIPERAISLMYNARSQDVPLGTPFNIASYGLLLEIIAKIVNMIPDELIANMGDCHIYLNQIDGIKEQLTRAPYTLPTLVINTEFWNHDYQSVGGLIDSMEIDDFKIVNYRSHQTIKIPLNN